MRQCSECGSAEGKIILFNRKTPYCWAHYLQMRRHGRVLSRTKYTPNRFLDCGTYIAIELFNMSGECVGRALVDKDMLSRVRKYKWHAVRLNHTTYAETIAPSREKVLLHVFILGKKKGLEIDHINGNGLDCRRNNLRHLTHFANILNRHRRLNKNGHMGLFWRADRGRWIASIIIGGKARRMSFVTKEEAIAQREQWEREVLAA